MNVNVVKGIFHWYKTLSGLKEVCGRSLPQARPLRRGSNCRLAEKETETSLPSTWITQKYWVDNSRRPDRPDGGAEPAVPAAALWAAGFP